MMQHSFLENGHWAELTFPQQMANIGSETSRIYKALESGKDARAESAFVRFQELIDLTIQFGRQNESAARLDDTVFVMETGNHRSIVNCLFCFKKQHRCDKRICQIIRKIIKGLHRTHLAFRKDPQMLDLDSINSSV